ncbi:MAG: A/G-specific adenine glycosylase [Pirellulaceae bacterium]|nr:A/G-specific adenine glycosylase [Pirellulaceae bacterium]
MSIAEDLPALPDEEWNRRFRRRLLGWFRKNARDLPWRRSQDPYPIWVSEIMLQQTQVETVKPYFKRFIERFPNVLALAKADEQEVLQLWEGLGYYRRARQLHRAAKIVRDEYQGQFPRDPVDVIALPGIGRYTAGAILSIAFDDRQPIVEGNTIRVYSRLLAYQQDPRSSAGQRLLWAFAASILPQRKAGQLNQALMELGSELCRPRSPQCDCCPVNELCPTNAHGWQEKIPVAGKKVAYEDLHEVAVVVQRRGMILIRQCAEGERWAGLWDFPRFSVREGQSLPAQIPEQVRGLTGVTVGGCRLLTEMKHVVTRYRITLSCFQADYQSGRKLPGTDCQWIKPNQLSDFPLSVTGRKISKMVKS